MPWDHNRDLHLALRALRAEAYGLRAMADKMVKWMDKAIAEWEQAERIRAVEGYFVPDTGFEPIPPPSQGNPNAQARQAESQWACAVCGASCAWLCPQRDCPQSTEQS